MRKLAIALTAATALGAAAAVPASAQGVYVGVGDCGFGVGVTGPYYYGSPYYGGWPGPYTGPRYAGSPDYYSPHYAYGTIYPAYGWL
jgi:hypothetical protein